MKQIITFFTLAAFSLVAFNTQAQTARVKVIHNSADLAADPVDVYLNGAILLDDFAFRTSSPFVDAPAGTNIRVSIAPGTSSDTSDAVAHFDYNLTNGEKYIIVANGIVSPSGYSPAVPFDLDVYAGAREMAATSGNVDVLLHHGSTDAPEFVDVYSPLSGSTLADNLQYGTFQGYLPVPVVVDVDVELRDSSQSTTIATYTAPVSSLSLEDSAITVIASGFVDPASNSNGPAFGVWVALAGGGDMVQLPVVTGIEDIDNVISAFDIYPNPTADQAKVEFSLVEGQAVSVQLTNTNGQTVVNKSLGNLAEGVYTDQIDLSNLSTGFYYYTLQLKEGTITKQILKTE